MSAGVSLSSISSILIIVGLGLYLLQASDIIIQDSFWYNTIGNIANTLLLGGSLSLLYQFFLKSREERQLHLLLRISESIRSSGIRTILTDSTEYNFNEIICNSETFTAIMNDGLRWVGNHSVRLEHRFDKQGVITEFFIVDPESDFCKALADKVNNKYAQLVQKINQTVELLNSTYIKTNQLGVLRIYFLKNYPTQSIFLTNDTVVVTPYQTASGRNIIPLFEYKYKKDIPSIGSHIFNDLNNVRSESRLIAENGRYI